jgi:hypothetical protein
VTGLDDPVHVEADGRTGLLNPRGPDLVRALDGLADVNEVESPDGWLIERGEQGAGV